MFIFASKNHGKLAEMKNIMAPLKIVGAEEIGLNEDIAETGLTFAANALIKARYVAKVTGHWSFADDTGLCVAVLKGEPGVYSKRFAGDNPSPEDFYGKILTALEGVSEKDRQAYFETAVALVSPKGEEWLFSGQAHGFITSEPRGTLRPRLPYDMIFQPQNYDRTFSEMTDEEKNSISHRGQAFRELKEFILNHETMFAS
ncbi:MAG: RdgB/HAM1 family non-canonical purine NTP pyrophosphatase [Candidatus Komeilibacteria bacterium]|nr:RdgB/HAM1 family non-canonical purine NTP pyrophosphatase [Candidatus Komeilibacteria bacterium]